MPTSSYTLSRLLLQEGLHELKQNRSAPGRQFNAQFSFLDNETNSIGKDKVQIQLGKQRAHLPTLSRTGQHC